jgi:hypothetical protein
MAQSRTLQADANPLQLLVALEQDATVADASSLGIAALAKTGTQAST